MNILRFIETGIYQRDREKAKASTFDWDDCYKEENHRTPFGIDHLNAAFFGLIIGLSTSCIIFIVEVVVAKWFSHLAFKLKFMHTLRNNTDTMCKKIQH